MSHEKLENSLDEKKLKKLHCIVAAVLLILVLSALYAVWSGEGSLTLFYIMDNIPIYFHVDALARVFVTVTSIVWLLAGFYAFIYMGHEGNEKRFFFFYILVYVVLIALELSGNLVTLYFFYELMTLTSMPLVLHNGSREAIMAALKYLFYSMCGAYCALFGIYFLYQYCDTLTFRAGGTLNMTLVSGNETILLISVLMMLIGFGAKAGMFPLHSWLTSAHPVAPAPASAVLSSIIVKGGVLAIIRSVYYIVGVDFIRGSFVQTAWIILTLLTVFMGSMLAYREKVFKKRLAYSTVSQVSYILFGLAMLTPEGFVGGVLHVICHAFIKCALFLAAGSFIFHTGRTRVDEYAGIGKHMNITLWCYTIASLALIGIPPMSGFISKWYLAQGALQSQTGIFRFLGPAVLLLSALLTAGYLLPVTIKGFLPGKDFIPETGEGKESECRKERLDIMNAALIILAWFSILFGVLPNPLISYVSEIAYRLFQGGIR
ncbi:MAG: proton-conducting membrane transporter [Lachnospiraceae bacterium]|nr:proton-conducting membrane transporter [Lachnospiraceae bacterium]